MLRVAFAGTPAFALPALDALQGAAYQLVGVLTQPDRPAGRGQGLRASPIKQRALALGLPVAAPVRLGSALERSALQSWAPDLLVVVAYGLLLPPAVLTLPRLGCLNIHASLLPRWRGAAPIQRAILAGDPVTGVTIMQLDAGLDTGPILAQRRVPAGADQTSADLHEILAQAGAELLLEVMAELETGRARPRAQSSEGVTYAAKFDKGTGLIDWSAPAEVIARQVRACNPWPVAHSSLNGEGVRIWRARAVPAATSVVHGPVEPVPVPPGAVVGLISGELLVSTGEGVLAVAELQSASRRRLGAADYCRGHALDGLKFG